MAELPDNKSCNRAGTHRVQPRVLIGNRFESFNSESQESQAKPHPVRAAPAKATSRVVAVHKTNYPADSTMPILCPIPRGTGTFPRSSLRHFIVGAE